LKKLEAYRYILMAANEMKVREVLNMANMAKIDRVFKGLGVIEHYEARGDLKGEARGKALGKALGEIEGEQKKALEIAGNLKKIGLPLEQIAASTGLTAKQIKAL
jgi:predicted transposase YdaD